MVQTLTALPSPQTIATPEDLSPSLDLFQALAARIKALGGPETLRQALADVQAR